MTSETFERPTAAAFECTFVCNTADSCRWGDWRMETTSPGLCSWNCWMVEHFM